MTNKATELETLLRGGGNSLVSNPNLRWKVEGVRFGPKQESWKGTLVLQYFQDVGDLVMSVMEYKQPMEAPTNLRAIEEVIIGSANYLMGKFKEAQEHQASIQLLCNLEKGI